VKPEETAAGPWSGEIARLISYVALFAVSAVMFVEAAGIPASRFEVLGAGAFPMLVHGALMALLLGCIVGTLRRTPRAAYAAFGAAARAWVAARRLVFLLLGCLGAYLIVMPVTGFGPATFVFLLALLGVLGPKTPAGIGAAVVLAAAFSFGLNWVFAEVFDVFLPRGV
jgi:hypothetical protein